MNPPTRGRSMRPNRDEAPPVVAAPPSPPPSADPAAPFANYGPGAGTMGEMAEENRSQSLGILAIVAGLGVAVAAAVIMMLLVILLWFVYETATDGSPLVAGAADKQHIRDTGSATPNAPVPGQNPGPRPIRNGGDPGDPTSTRDPSLGPPPGPVTIIVPSKMMFLSIEVGCPGGFRNRGNFVKDPKSTKHATVGNVPGDERCTVTFQGSEPATTFATGNQTLSCTFRPVVCSPVH